MQILVTITDDELLRLFKGTEGYLNILNNNKITYINHKDTEEIYEQKVVNAEIIVASWGSRQLKTSLLKKAENLKLITYAAGSLTHLVEADFFELNIPIVNANNVLAQATAEGTFAMMLSGAYDLFGYRDQVAENVWSNNNEDTVLGISGCLIGLVGLGAISKELIRLLAPLKPRIQLYSSYCLESEANELGVNLVSLDELFETSDIISIHSTLNEKTNGLIKQHHLDLVKDNALLINTARAHIIVETDLIQALTSGRFRAILDVHYQEPIPDLSPFRQFKHVTLLPHIAAFSRFYKKQLFQSVIDDYQNLCAQRPLKGLITQEAYMRMTR